MCDKQLYRKADPPKTPEEIAAEKKKRVLERDPEAGSKFIEENFR